TLLAATMRYATRALDLCASVPLITGALWAGAACNSTVRPPAAAPARVAPAPSAAAPPAVPAPSEEIATRETPEQTAAIEERKACGAKRRPREKALCYLESESEASIEALFDLGRSLGEEGSARNVEPGPDFTYAAENAGILAAKTDDARLFTGIQSSNEGEQ